MDRERSERAELQRQYAGEMEQKRKEEEASRLEKKRILQELRHQGPIKPNAGLTRHPSCLRFRTCA